MPEWSFIRSTKPASCGWISIPYFSEEKHMRHIFKLASLLLVLAFVASACGTPATQAPAAPAAPAATEAPAQPAAPAAGSFQIPDIEQGKFNIAAVLIGPHDDGGWSQAHYEGLMYVEKNVPNTHIAYIENVPEGADSE